MKVSVFGSGSIGLRHLNNLIKLKKELKISSIYSYDTKNKKKFLGESKKFTFTQNLRVAAENCDVAFICVPTHLHNQTINKILKYNSRNEKGEPQTLHHSKKQFSSISKKIALGI